METQQITSLLIFPKPMPQFTDEEKALLSKYVTNTDKDVFALKNLPGIAGAVYARYSRAKTGFRETLLKEFIQEGVISHEHAEELIERILVAYGDDSVGELEGAHVSFENISILATKEIEDRRIGGSPIEKSTRYVFFNEKDEEGNYRYVREPKIMSSPYASAYLETMDFVFDTYSELLEPMQKFYQNLFPFDKATYDILGTGEKQSFAELIEEKDQKAFNTTYKIDLKTKACDTLRCLLPLSTKTNVGMFGNGRFYQGLISHLLSTNYPEVSTIGLELFKELSKIIPKYVHRAQPKKYNMAIDVEMKKLANKILSSVNVDEAEKITLVPLELRNGEDYLVAHMLYGYTEHPLKQIHRLVRNLDETTRDLIKKTYVGERQTRRDRPGRALECGYTYTFDLFADFGTYKDLMRHRMNTQIRQTFSPAHGIIIPQDLIDAGFEKQVLLCQEKVLNLYKVLYTNLGEVASYVTLHGNRVRWIMGFNDREAMHMLELRTTKQGHPQYRKLCQEMHKEIEKIDSWRASIMNFVDHNSYDSARGDSEAKQRVKEQMLDEKYKKTN
jgi:thymidylate synthase ThyX